MQTVELAKAAGDTFYSGVIQPCSLKVEIRWDLALNQHAEAVNKCLM